MTSQAFLLHLLSSVLTLIVGLTVTPAAQVGVEVVEVKAGSRAADAGLRTADRIVAWEKTTGEDLCFEARGELANIFDWEWLVSELAPRAEVRLWVKRQEQELAIDISPGPWNLKVWPELPADLAETAAKLRHLVATDKKDKALVLRRQLIETAGLAVEIAVWLGQRQMAANPDPDLLSSMERHVARLNVAPGSTAGRLAAEALAQAYVSAGDWTRAAQTLTRLVAAEDESCPGSFRAARVRYLFGTVLRNLEASAKAEKWLQEAAWQQEALAGDSLELATTLRILGASIAMQGELERSVPILERALALASTLAPAGQELASALTLTDVLKWMGAYDEAEAAIRQAADLLRDLTEDPMAMARIFAAWGDLEFHRGDFELARSYLLNALESTQALSNSGQVTAKILRQLGILAFEQDDFAQAEIYFRATLPLNQQQGWLKLTGSLEDLGLVALKQGDVEQARGFFLRSLAITKDRWPQSRLVASLLLKLGRASLAAGELADAQANFEEARRLAVQLSEKLLHGSALLGLARWAAARHELDSAIDFAERALALFQSTVPTSFYAVQAAGQLGEIAAQAGRLETALRAYRLATSTLDLMSYNLGRSADLSNQFRSHYRDLYQQHVDLLMTAGRPVEAFAVLEDQRAKGFLAVFSERDHLLADQMSPELEARLRSNRESLDRLQWQLAQPDAATRPDRQALYLELETLRAERENVLRDVHASAPRLAALRYPRPLGVSEVQTHLDPGTVLLSYSLGKTRLHVFVLTRTSFKSLSLPLAKADLANRIAQFRSLILQGTSVGAIGANRRANLNRASAELYSDLIAPVEAEVLAGSRLVIVPEGPLHLLPWAALGRKADASAPAELTYLIAELPIHLALSGTVYVELQAARKPLLGVQNSLVTFADPALPPEMRTATPQTTDVRVRALLERGYRFAALPAARSEVAGIKQLYPQAEIFVGNEATEEQVKRLGPTSRYLHFATHSILDERFPLNSAIVLAVPSDLKSQTENGLLQVWEVTEQLRLDAELVVLSACESALGKTLSGDGLIGLARAFHYAGARSVLASLWKVADTTTALLMERFYHHLKAGKNKDAALRAAQLDLLDHHGRGLGEAGPADLSSPWFWAAFQIYGDWQ